MAAWGACLLCTFRFVAGFYILPGARVNIQSGLTKNDSPVIIGRMKSVLSTSIASFIGVWIVIAMYDGFKESAVRVRQGGPRAWARLCISAICFIQQT